MSFPTIATPSNAYHRPAPFVAVYARPSGGKYQTLGVIAETSLSFADFASPNSKGQNRANNSSGFTAGCKMLQCSDIELELLDSLLDGTNDFLFKMADAGTIPTTTPAATEGWVLLTASQVGLHATVDFSGDPNNDGFILLEWQGSLLNSLKAAAVKASIADVHFEDTNDTGTFHDIGTYTEANDGGNETPSHKMACGIASVTLAYTGGEAQTLGDITNVKMTFAFTEGQPNSRRMFAPTRVDINIEYDGMETNAANLINLADYVKSAIDAVITMSNGLVWLLTDKVGIATDYKAEGDMDKDKYVHVIHTGQIVKSAFDGIVS